MKPLLAALALALAAGLQEPDEDARWKKIEAARAAGQALDARQLLLDFLAKHARSRRIPSALRLLAGTYGTESTSERRAAVEILRRLHKEHPDHPETAGSRSDVERVTGWRFASVPGFVMVRPEKTVPLTRNLDPEREYGPGIALRIFRLPTDLFRRTVEAAWKEPEKDSLQPWQEIPRDRWEFQGQTNLQYPGDPKEVQRVDLGFNRPGVYLVEEVIEGFHCVNRVYVGTFGVAVKSLPEKTLVYALNPDTGAPVEGVDVAFWSKGKPMVRKTDRQGLALFDSGSATGIVASREGEIYACSLGERDAAEEDSLVYITTDRPVYRPGQKVHYKAVRRDRRGRTLSFRAGERVKVEIRDPSERRLKTEEIAWNEAGSLSGSFTLGDEPPLGEYEVVVRVESKDPDFRFDRIRDREEPSFWTKSVLVAAYRKPEVRVSVEMADPAPLRGQEVRARVRAEYYFGGPVADAEVEWAAETAWESRPDARWPRPPFEDARMWFLSRDDSPETYWGGREIASGKGTTRADGTLAISFHLPSDLAMEDCRITARVRDLSRLETEGSTRFRALGSSLTVRVGTPRMFYRPGDRIQARVRVTGPDGKPMGARDVELVGFMARPEAGPEAEMEFEPFFAGKSRTEETGLAIFELGADAAGRLRLRATVRDGQGRPSVDRADLWVAGEEAAPASRDGTADLSVLADRVVYEEGETAHLMVRSTEKPLTALLTIEGDTFHEARVVRLAKRCEVLDVPILAAHGPNAFVKLHAWKDGRAYGGGFEIFVYPRRKFVDVDVRTDRAVYGPRQKVRVSLDTRVGGEGVPSEVELGIVDESIFAIAADQTKDIRKFFHRKREDEAWLFGSCAPADGYDSYAWVPSAGGPLTGATFALDEPRKVMVSTLAVDFIPTETRRFFPDTLAWLAHVKTGANGRAEIDLETPDSLTTWRVVARAVSGTDRFGQGFSAMLTRKDVIVRLTAPRFFTERDAGTVSTAVHNDLPAEVEFTVRLKAEGLEAEAGDRKVRVPSRGVKRLDWKVKAVRAGAAKLYAEALSNVGSDAIEIALPVRPHGLEQTVAKAGGVGDRWRDVLVLPQGVAKEAASLEVTVTSGGLSAAVEALPYLAGYPYGCVEQTLSRFLPSVVAWGALKRLGLPNPSLEAALPEMVDRGLQRLYGFQHEDGGWGWWTHDETHPFMTAYALHGLLLARQAGFPVDARTIDAGLERLARMEPTAFALYVLKTGGILEARGPHSYRVRSKEGGRDFEFKPAGAEDHAYLVLAGRTELAAGLPTLRADKAGGEEIRLQALFLRAIAAADPRDPRIGPLVEWLLSRRVGSAWISTLDTAYAVYALSSVGGPEEEPQVTVVVNGREVSAKTGRLALPGTALQEGENTVEVRRARGRLVFASALLRYYTQAEPLAPLRGAFVVARLFQRAYRDGNEQKWEILESGSEVSVGDEVRVLVSLRPREGGSYVMLECPLPAGVEPCPEEDEEGEWRFWYGRREMRDDRACVAAQSLFGAVNEFVFRVRPTFPGEYHVMPAAAFGMYAPDQRGTSGEFLLRVVDK